MFEEIIHWAVPVLGGLVLSLVKVIFDLRSEQKLMEKDIKNLNDDISEAKDDRAAIRRELNKKEDETKAEVEKIHNKIGEVFKKLDEMPERLINLLNLNKSK